MTHDDGSTVRLPGDRGASPDLPDRGFGYDQGAAPDAFAESGYDTGYDTGYGGYGGDETTRFDPGYAQPYQAAPPDQTIAIGADAAVGSGKDRMLVHLVWEILLIVLVAGLAGYAYMTEPKLFSTAGRPELLLTAAVFGLMAMGLSLSVRAAAPNLAVGGVAVASGVVFAKLHGHGTLSAVGLSVGVALLVGLAMGIVVAVLHVPSWAASLGGLVGTVALARGLAGGRTIELGGHPYDPARQATLWFGAFAVVSVVAGILLLMPPLRRAVGAFRPVGDPAARRGPGAAFMAMVALVVSSGLAGGAGVLSTLHAGAASGAADDGLLSTALVLGAVLVGGVSAYGRRGGLLGTALGVFAVSVAVEYAAIKQWNFAVAQLLVAAGAVALGLVVTRLVEWGGRPRGPEWTE
jgi:ribose/xylose/arabinose/galactoside ABC-type transport system permease subunit